MHKKSNSKKQNTLILFKKWMIKIGYNNRKVIVNTIWQLMIYRKKILNMLLTWKQIIINSLKICKQSINRTLQHKNKSMSLWSKTFSFKIVNSWILLLKTFKLVMQPILKILINYKDSNEKSWQHFKKLKENKMNVHFKIKGSVMNNIVLIWKLESSSMKMMSKNLKALKL